MSSHPITTSPGILTIDLDALASNFCALRAAASGDCAAVVKANAYGLGVEPVARRLFDEGCRHFFVANMAEGLELRGFLPEGSIFVFEGAFPGQEKTLLKANLTPILNSVKQINCWRDVAAGSAVAVHIDTGMSRLGLSELEIEEVVKQNLLDSLDLEYVITHLACADEPSHPLNIDQLMTFNKLRARLPKSKTSIGNSAGTLIGKQYCGDLIRPGIALFGGNPFVQEPNPMKTVVSLHGAVIQVREITKTVNIGYGATYKIDSPARLATVGVGYADGYPRALSNCGHAFVAGKKVPVVGRVSMDLITLDISDISNEHVRVGEPVELLGTNIPLDEIANHAGTIGYEILTGLGKRWSKRYVGI